MIANTFTYNREFNFESGEKLPSIKIAYHTAGKLNKEKSNLVWVFHALTANSNVFNWWAGLMGENDLFNSKEHFIICANIIGSPYGSTSPDDLNFPQFTVRDIVSAHILLAKELGINTIYTAIGGSLGGSQALEFAHSFKGKIENLVLVACAAKESAWGIAIHEAQRLAIEADNSFGQQYGGQKGLKAARAIGMLVYRTSKSINQAQSDDDDRTNDFKAASYIQYQGEKLVKRFNAIAYYYLTKCLDSHNVGRERGGIDNALSKINTRTLVIGIDSDELLPTMSQKEIAEHLPNSVYQEINSEFGHDGFLIETPQLTQKIKSFLNK